MVNSSFGALGSTVLYAGTMRAAYRRDSHERSYQEIALTLIAIVTADPCHGVGQIRFVASFRDQVQ